MAKGSYLAHNTAPANIKEGLGRIQRVLAYWGGLFSCFGVVLVGVLGIGNDYQQFEFWLKVLSSFLLGWGPYLLFAAVSWIVRGFLDIDDD